MDCTEARQLRHHFLDGEFEPVEAPDVEEHLASCTACRAVYDSEHALSTAIRTHALRFTAPPELRARIGNSLAQAGAPRGLFSDLRLLAVGWNPVAIAASVALAMIASIAATGWYVRAPDADAIVQQVVASHIRSLISDRLADVESSDRDTVKPWFNGRVEATPPVVDLAAEGFSLVGGRLDYVERQPVATVVYRRQAHIINVFVWPKGTEAAGLETFSKSGYNVIHAVDGDKNYWAVCDLNADVLRGFVLRLVMSDQPKPQPS
jgi:anti-sigma factor (TIGR02949 family)